MLRRREDELHIMKEDSAAKEKELLHALELLQGAQQRESELRRQAQNLSNQLDLALDALEAAQKDPTTTLEDPDDDDPRAAQLEVALLALAEAREEAQLFQSVAATMQSALKSSEDQVAEVHGKLAMLQEYVHQNFDENTATKKGGGDSERNGSRHAMGRLAATVAVARVAVHALGLVARML